MSKILKLVFLFWASSAVCQGLRVPDLTKLVARVMSQEPEAQIPIGITDKLIRKWAHKCSKIECREDRDINPELAKMMDKLIKISHINPFDCQQISSFLERLEVEHDINENFINIYPYVKFMNGITFSKCLYDFHARVDEILSRLSDESRSTLDRLAEASHLRKFPDESLTLLGKLDDHGLLNGRSKLVQPYLNQLTRSYHMEVAIYMTHHINRLYSNQHETLQQHKIYFIQEYDRLIYQPCEMIHEDMNKWSSYVLFNTAGDGQQVNFHLDKNHIWIRFHTVCTILGDKNKQVHENIYSYFMTHLDSRDPPKELTYDQTLDRVSYVSPPTHEQPSVVTMLRNEGLWTAIEPYKTLEDLKKLTCNNTPTLELFVDMESLGDLIELSNVTKEKCKTEFINNRLSQLQIMDHLGNIRNLGENIAHYIRYFNDLQFKLCGYLLYFALSHLLKHSDDENLVRLEQLKRFAIEFSYIEEDQEFHLQTFHRAAAAFLHLYEYPFRTPISTKINSLFEKMCAPFTRTSNFYRSSLVSMLNNLRLINNSIQIDAIIRNFVRYENTCSLYRLTTHRYVQISRYLREGGPLMSTSFHEIWLTVSKKRSMLSLNWLKT